MKVFISWSGEPSRLLAVALAEWFPKVLQGIEPFVSSKDIDKGATWASELARELEDTDFGIVCLTPENLASPWLHYEAGALAKSVTSRVCPVLLRVSKDRVASPLDQLQMTALEPADVLHLMESMNKAAGGLIEKHQLAETVDVWWPRLEAEIGAIDVPEADPEETVGAEPKQPEPLVTEMLSEILRRMRNLERSNSDSSRPRSGRARDRRSEDDVHAQEFMRRRIEAVGVDVVSMGLYPDGIVLEVSDDFKNDKLPSSVILAMRTVVRNEGYSVRLDTPSSTHIYTPNEDLETLPLDVEAKSKEEAVRADVPLELGQ
jgi:hypothetical protein